MPVPIPRQVSEAIAKASDLTNHCPDIPRHSIFPTTSGKVKVILKPATDFIFQQTGIEVLDKNYTAKEMVRIVSKELLNLDLSHHDDKPAKPVGGKI